MHLRPDLAWREGRSYTFVGDAKYKRLAPAGFEHADVYQMLAYCTAVGLPSGLLVYAAGESEAGSYKIRNAGKTIEVTSIDLECSLEEVWPKWANSPNGSRRILTRRFTDARHRGGWFGGWGKMVGAARFERAAPAPHAGALPGCATPRLTGLYHAGGTGLGAACAIVLTVEPGTWVTVG